MVAFIEVEAFSIRYKVPRRIFMDILERQKSPRHRVNQYHSVVELIKQRR